MSSRISPSPILSPRLWLRRARDPLQQSQPSPGQAGAAKSIKILSHPFLSSRGSPGVQMARCILSAARLPSKSTRHFTACLSLKKKKKINKSGMCTHAACCRVCVSMKNESSGFLHLNICTSTGLNNPWFSALLHPCPETTPKLLGPTGAGTFWLSCSSQGTGKWLFSTK